MATTVLRGPELDQSSALQLEYKRYLLLSNVSLVCKQVLMQTSR